ncbi:MAG TPA: hypothetical protein VGK73_04845 [Polyangiaceae bacterium]
MSPQERVARLEHLLERVRKNRALARPAAGAAPVALPAAKSSPAASEAKSSPAASEAKLASRPHAPPPIVEPAPPVFEPPVAEAAELEPATLPPAPPEPAIVAAPEPAIVAVPEPPPVPPMPEVTPVMVTPEPSPVAPGAAWTAERPSAVQARPVSLPPEELSDDDLLEVTTIPPEPEAAPAAELEVAPEVSVAAEAVEIEAEEQPPASSRRSKVAETLDEALASAAQLEQEEEREVPVKTPPPESGPQEAAPLPAGLAAPGLPDVEGLEADMLGPPSMGPTAEQLGETIELDAPRGPELEIDVASAVPAPEPERPPEELEMTLPRAPMPSGTYDVSMSPPVDVEVRGAAEASLPPIEVGPSDFIPTVPAHAPPPEELAPERTARVQLGATDVARVVRAPSSPPRNFVELLDTSLGL